MSRRRDIHIIIRGVMAAVCCAVMSALCGCQPQTEFEIARWKGFKQCAVTYTFEDSYDRQFSVALPMFFKYDFPCTFFLCTKWCDQNKWDLMREAIGRGCEVGSHTVNHEVYDTLTPEKQKQNILDANARINVKLPMYKCNTFAHTDCVVGDTSVLSKHYIGCRGCQGYIEGPTPHNYMNISSIVCGKHSTVKKLDDFLESLHTAKKTGGWCIFSLYDLDDGNGWSPLSSEILDQSLQHIKDMDKANAYWVGTFRDVVKYTKERDRAKIEIVCTDDDRIRASLTADLDEDVYNYPLTIRCPLPFGWREVEVLQKEKVVKYEVRTVNACKYIIFEAVPNKGDIYLINLVDCEGKHH